MIVWGVLNSGQSEGADFLAQHTLLQVCHPLASVLEKGTTKKEGKECGSALSKKE